MHTYIAVVRSLRVPLLPSPSSRGFVRASCRQPGSSSKAGASNRVEHEERGSEEVRGLDSTGDESCVRASLASHRRTPHTRSINNLPASLRFVVESCVADRSSRSGYMTRIPTLPLSPRKVRRGNRRSIEPHSFFFSLETFIDFRGRITIFVILGSLRGTSV